LSGLGEKKLAVIKRDAGESQWAKKIIAAASRPKDVLLGGEKKDNAEKTKFTNAGACCELKGHKNRENTREQFEQELIAQTKLSLKQKRTDGKWKKRKRGKK